MYLLINGLNVGSAAVNLTDQLGTTKGFIHFSGATGGAAMDINVLSFSYSQFVINGGFEYALNPTSSWTLSSTLQPTGTVPGTSCAAASFSMVANSSLVCSKVSNRNPFRGSRALVRTIVFIPLPYRCLLIERIFVLSGVDWISRGSCG